MKALTLKTIADQDWKTQAVQGYQNIPANTIVEVINDDFNNFYGSWCIVEWRRHTYYVDKRFLSFDLDDIKNSEKSEEI